MNENNFLYHTIIAALFAAFIFHAVSSLANEPRTMVNDEEQYHRDFEALCRARGKIFVKTKRGLFCVTPEELNELLIKLNK